MMQQVSPTRGGGVDPGRRPVKRQRLSTSPFRPTPAALALLERVATIRAYSIELRDDHQGLIDDFDKRAAAKRAASKAAAKLTPAPPPAAEVQLFSKGDIIAKKPPGRAPALDVQAIWQGDAIRSDTVCPGRKKGRPTAAVAALPAMSLLVEPEPPEKVMVEQSVIWRAHMINRRNAELARERLPKQPEAQRGKTHWDYMLDEAVWLSNDFREERKWKMSMARKVSKMVVQYHAQRVQRVERARRDERVRLIRLANSVARDVRKFWSQIHEVAEYRQSVIRDAQIAEEREGHLKFLLKQTEAYTNVLASNLNVKAVSTTVSVPQLSHEVAAEVASNGSGPVSTELTRNRASSQTDAERGGGDFPCGGSRKRSRVHFEQDLKASPQGAVGRPVDENSDDELRMGVAENDEATLDAAEAEQGEDPEEIDNLKNDCEMSAEDDEATLDAAEAEQEEDPEEIDNLKNDCEMSVEDLLRQQGIDPASYKQDSGQYAESSSGDSASSDSEAGEDGYGDKKTGENGDENAVPDVDDEGGYVDKGSESNERAVNEMEAMNVDGKGEGEGVVLSASNEPSSAILPVAPVPPEHTAGRAPSVASSPTGPKDDVPKSLDAAVAEFVRDGGNGGDRSEDLDADVLVATDAAKCGEEPSDISVRHDRSGLADATQKLAPPTLLLRGTLREYQQAGMEWLVTLYKQKLNGILADEMGLGKTIQTISLLAWLAVERGVWGPHLVVVPTSVMINWEVEFKKWLPGFKIMTYYGSMKERRAKRQGWSKKNAFHVCITSYNLVVQDASALRRKKWVYLILDEAHNIKNFQSQRWQTLLNFPSKRRLLLTGTPLQNSVMELWSLMHFLMPDVFRSHAEFKDWFSKPLNTIVTASGDSAGREQTSVVANLHRVLRPFLLRRLKADVEKNLPGKFEHIVPCPLSKRQRQLYEDFMARSDIKETLNSGDFIGVMNVLMQLRKVCNHPDLFEGRPIVSPFSMKPLFYPVPSAVVRVVNGSGAEKVDLSLLGLDLATAEVEGWPGSWFVSRCSELSASRSIQAALEQVRDDDYLIQVSSSSTGSPTISDAARQASRRAAIAKRATLRRNSLLSELRTRRRGMLGADLVASATMTPASLLGNIRAHRSGRWDVCTNAIASSVWDLEILGKRGAGISERFVSVVHTVVAPIVEMRYVGDDRCHVDDILAARQLARVSLPLRLLYRSYDVRSNVMLPDSRLVQWDCGKLQVLDRLMRKLKNGDHRVLIFTQMTRVLDVLEAFLNLHAHRYLRLDGATKTEERQKLVERFNTDKRVFCMILTTRAGGLGLNLTGADTVIFYDTDYNPAMDAQAQDRAHRIGQVRPVHIYRLVSEQTVEENILRKAQQKRTLESLVISKAGFTTDAFREKLDVMALVTTPTSAPLGSSPAGSSDLPGCAVLPQGEVGVKGAPVTGNEQESLPGELDDVGAAVLAREDEREGLAASERQKEVQLTLAEFDEVVPGTSGVVAAAASKDPGSVGDGDILSGLTAVQRYALRLVEEIHSTAAEKIGMDDVGIGDNRTGCSSDSGPTWQKDFSVEEMLRRHEHDELSSSESIANGDDEYDMDEDEGADELVYELDTTSTGRMAYLKALTDTDADIKLYLPLRDGDPEELKKSAVVNGTAAAGLECAEDAAFFPHAYNRMSRTPYATPRQKEKADANLLRRIQEEKRSKERERQEAAEIAAKKKSLAAASAAASAAAVEKGKVASKNRALVGAQPKGAPGSQGTKRARSDSLPTRRVGNASGAQGFGISTDGSASGLFTKPSKKAKVKGNSAFNGKISGASKEEIGLNDRWTTGEEQRLLEMVSAHNKNMLLVADALKLSPQAVAGHRMLRGQKRCIDRMKTLTKDVKNGPPVSKASTGDSENMRAHVKALIAAARIIKTSPPTWARTVAPGGAPHDSHVKAFNDVAGRAGKRFSTSPPTYAAIADLVSAPEYHVPGLKSVDCTPAAVARRRRPFLRPRAINERRPVASFGPSQRPTTPASASVVAGVGHPYAPPPVPRSQQAITSRASGSSRGDRGASAAGPLAPSAAIAGSGTGARAVKRQSNVVYKMAGTSSSVAGHGGLPVARAPSPAVGGGAARGPLPAVSGATLPAMPGAPMRSGSFAAGKAQLVAHSAGGAPGISTSQTRRGPGPLSGSGVGRPRSASSVANSQPAALAATGALATRNTLGTAQVGHVSSGPPALALAQTAPLPARSGMALSAIPSLSTPGAQANTTPVVKPGDAPAIPSARIASGRGARPVVSGVPGAGTPSSAPQFVSGSEPSRNHLSHLSPHAQVVGGDHVHALAPADAIVAPATRVVHGGAAGPTIAISGATRGIPFVAGQSVPVAPSIPGSIATPIVHPDLSTTGSSSAVSRPSAPVRAEFTAIPPVSDASANAQPSPCPSVTPASSAPSAPKSHRHVPISVPSSAQTFGDDTPAINIALGVSAAASSMPRTTQTAPSGTSGPAPAGALLRGGNAANTLPVSGPRTQMPAPVAPSLSVVHGSGPLAASAVMSSATVSPAVPAGSTAHLAVTGSAGGQFIAGSSTTPVVASRVGKVAVSQAVGHTGEPQGVVPAQQGAVPAVSQKADEGLDGCGSGRNGKS